MLANLFLDEKHCYDTKELATKSTIYVVPNEPYYIRTSKKNKKLILLLSHCFAFVLLVSGYKSILNSLEQFSFATVFYAFFIVIAPLFAWYYFTDNRSKLVISLEGIAKDKRDFYQWSLISKTYIKEVVQTTNKYFLVLELCYNQAEKAEVDISFLDRKPDDIALIVETFKNKAQPITRAL